MNLPPDPNKPDPNNPETQRAEQDLQETSERLQAVSTSVRAIATTLGITIPYKRTVAAPVNAWRPHHSDIARQGAIMMKSGGKYFATAGFTGGELKADADELYEITEAKGKVSGLLEALSGRESDLRCRLTANGTTLLNGVNCIITNPLTDPVTLSDVTELSRGIRAIAAKYNQGVAAARRDNAGLRGTGADTIATLTDEVQQANATIGVLRGGTLSGSSPASPVPKGKRKRKSKKASTPPTIPSAPGGASGAARRTPR